MEKGKIKRNTYILTPLLLEHKHTNYPACHPEQCPLTFGVHPMGEDVIGPNGLNKTHMYMKARKGLSKTLHTHIHTHTLRQSLRTYWSPSAISNENQPKPTHTVWIVSVVCLWCVCIGGMGSSSGISNGFRVTHDKKRLVIKNLFILFKNIKSTWGMFNTPTTKIYWLGSSICYVLACQVCPLSQ